MLHGDRVGKYIVKNVFLGPKNSKHPLSMVWAEFIFIWPNFLVLLAEHCSGDLATLNPAHKISVHRVLARGSESVSSGMCKYVWGPLQRLRGPYVIPYLASSTYNICGELTILFPYPADF